MFSHCGSFITDHFCFPDTILVAQKAADAIKLLQNKDVETLVS